MIAGKFCQRSDFPEIFTFTEPDQLLRHLRNPDYNTLSVLCPNEDVCMVWSRKIPELCTGGRYTNLALPIFITSYGRLHLFDYMKQVRRELVNIVISVAVIVSFFR